jgi:hypothetical protein
MKEEIYRFFIGGEHFQREFWQEIRVLLIFTLGFTIAFTWRQTIFDSTKAVVAFVTHIKSSTALSITTSIVTTFFCLFLIWGMSKLMEKKG